MILPDYPIQTKETDRLKRTPLAQKVAGLIADFKDQESFVIGVEGPWGSGKTSFVNLVLEQLSASDEVVVIKFNPWNFSGQNELIEDFFQSLAEAIKKLNAEESAIKKIRRYSSKLTRKGEFVFSPEISVLGIFNVKAGELKSFGGSKTLEDERKEIDTILKGLNKKFLIVIDDIDRLDKLETRLILKLVKMTANFPNSIFLLAYDRQKVAQRISEDGWPGDEYLKKIIQVSFSLPEPQREDLWGILFADLDTSIEQIYGKINLNDEDQKHWDTIFHGGFGKLFKTIRDIKRYISSLRLDWSIVGKDDVNMVDFMVMEGVRVFAPDFYAAIAANKSLFTGVMDFYEGLTSHDNQNAKKDKFQELLALAPADIRPPIENICKELFPRLMGGSSYGGDWDQIWRKELRICSDEKFDFYFQLGIPTGAVSEVEMNALLKTLDSEKNLGENLLRFSTEKRVKKVLDKLVDHLPNLTEQQLKVLVETLWNLEGKIGDEREGAFDLNDTETQVSRLAYHSTKSIPAEKRENFLEDILDNSKTLFYPIRFIAVLMDEAEKKGQRIEPPLLEDADVEKIKQIAVKRIEAAASDESLANEPRLLFFLFRWKEWVSEAKVQDYIKGLIASRAGLLKFLTNSVGKVYSSRKNYNRLDKPALGKIYPLDELEKTVAAVSDDELAKMTDKEREAIELFRNPKDF